MAFRFKLDEPISKGFRRIGLEQIDRAERELGAAADEELAIHETRKCLKRIRALLRLVRPGLGEAHYRAENARYREIARQLSPARDSFVLCETVRKLESAPGFARSAALAAVKKILEENRQSAPTMPDRRTKEVLAKLGAAKKRLRRFSLKPQGFTTIGRGLEASYRKGRRAFAAAYAGGGDEVFHECRKSVQQHWRHMALLSYTWPDLFNARVAAARELSQILGDEHDLSILIEFIRTVPAQRLAAAHAREIQRVARARQKDLRKAAKPRGAQLFAEGAKGLSRRVGLMWHAARKIDRGVDEAAQASAAQLMKKPA